MAVVKSNEQRYWAERELQAIDSGEIDLENAVPRGLIQSSKIPNDDPNKELESAA